MSNRGEIARLAEIARPVVGVVTSVHAVHLTPGAQSRVARAKGELFFGLPQDGIAVANADDSRVMAQAKASGRKVVTFGREKRGRLLAVDSVWRGVSRQRLRGDRPDPSRAARRAQRDQRLCRARRGGRFRCQHRASRGRTGVGRPAAHRLQLVPLDRGISLLDDCYNASPASMRAALDTLRRAAAGRRMGAVLGDMLELGPDELSLHREVGRASRGLGWVLAVGPRCRGDRSRRARGRRPHRLSPRRSRGPAAHRAALLGELLEEPGDAFLLKGSQRHAARAGDPGRLGVSSPGDAGAR